MVASTSSTTTAGSTPRPWAASTAAARSSRTTTSPVMSSTAARSRAGTDRSTAEGQQAAAVEVDEGGPLAGAALLGGADVEHAALVDELGDQVRHGHLGDPDLAGQLGPAGRPEPAQGLQHEREVLATAVRGEDGCRGPHAARHCAGHEG